MLERNSISALADSSRSGTVACEVDFLLACDWPSGCSAEPPAGAQEAQSPALRELIKAFRPRYTVFGLGGESALREGRQLGTRNRECPVAAGRCDSRRAPDGVALSA